MKNTIIKTITIASIFITSTSAISQQFVFRNSSNGYSNTTTIEDHTEQSDPWFNKFNPFDPNRSLTRIKKIDTTSYDKVLVLGDSISNEFKIPKGSGWVQNMQNFYLERKRPIEIVNVSKNGTTTREGKYILEEHITDPKIKYVIIALGSTDFYKNISLDDTRKQLNTIIEDVLMYQKIPILIGLQLNGDNIPRAYKEDFYRMYTNLANQKRIAFVPYLYRGVNDTTNWRNNFQEDQFHTNTSAQDILANNVLIVLDNSIRIKNKDDKEKVQ